MHASPHAQWSVDGPQKPLSAHVGVVGVLTAEQLGIFVVPDLHVGAVSPPQVSTLTPLEHWRLGPQLQTPTPKQHFQLDPMLHEPVEPSPAPGVTPGPHRHELAVNAQVYDTAGMHAHDPLSGQPDSLQHTPPRGSHATELVGIAVEQSHPSPVVSQPNVAFTMPPSPPPPSTLVVVHAPRQTKAANEPTHAAVTRPQHD